MGTEAAIRTNYSKGNFGQEQRSGSSPGVQADKLAMAKFSIKLDKLLSAETVFTKRLSSFAARCCGVTPITGPEILSERERHFPALLLAARVYEHLLNTHQAKLAKEFAACRVRSMLEEHRDLGKRIQRRPGNLQAPLWRLLSQETQRLTTHRSWEFSITVSARSVWESYAWSDSDGGDWVRVGAKTGQHEKTVGGADWLDAIAKKVLGTPGVVDRRDGSLNVDKVLDVPELLKLAMCLAPVYIRARRDFFVTQLTQQLRYHTDQTTRFSRVDGIEMEANTAILHLVAGIPEVLFAEVSRYRSSQRAA